MTHNWQEIKIDFLETMNIFLPQNLYGGRGWFIFFQIFGKKKSDFYEYVIYKLEFLEKLMSFCLIINIKNYYFFDHM